MTKMKLLDVHEAIVNTRKNKDLSKSAASREMGVTRLTYDMWEKGAWVPDVDKAKMIASFTDLPLDQVLTTLLRLNGVIDKSAHLELHND